jgi:endonuclease IV
VPGSFKKYSNLWEKIKTPFILHAPHSLAGLNLSKKNLEQENRKKIMEVELYRKKLNPEYIIFHPGLNGTLQETIRQITVFKRDYQEVFSIGLIENKPKVGVNGEKCTGCSTEQIRELIENTGLGFCLDFGHAICFAASEGGDPQKKVLEFLKLNPKIYHLSDGFVNEEKDRHLHFGRGDYDLAWIISLLDESSLLSIETKNDAKDKLDDFADDVSFLRKAITESRT